MTDKYWWWALTMAGSLSQSLIRLHREADSPPGPFFSLTPLGHPFTYSWRPIRSPWSCIHHNFTIITLSVRPVRFNYKLNFWLLNSIFNPELAVVATIFFFFWSLSHLQLNPSNKLCLLKMFTMSCSWTGEVSPTSSTKLKKDN